jgi:hypothetical protein
MLETCEYHSTRLVMTILTSYDMSLYDQYALTFQLIDIDRVLILLRLSCKDIKAFRRLLIIERRAIESS